jgi:hypothetical protein
VQYKIFAGEMTFMRAEFLSDIARQHVEPTATKGAVFFKFFHTLRQLTAIGRTVFLSGPMGPHIELSVTAGTTLLNYLTH